MMGLRPPAESTSATAWNPAATATSGFVEPSVGRNRTGQGTMGLAPIQRQPGVFRDGKTGAFHTIGQTSLRSPGEIIVQEPLFQKPVPITTSTRPVTGGASRDLGSYQSPVFDDYGMDPSQPTLTEKQVEEYTYVVIESLCALAEVGVACLPEAIYDMSVTLHPEIFVVKEILFEVLDHGVLKARFLKSIDPPGYRINPKLGNMLGANEKYGIFVRQVATTAQKRAQMKQNDYAGQRTPYDMESQIYTSNVRATPIAFSTDVSIRAASNDPLLVRRAAGDDGFASSFQLSGGARSRSLQPMAQEASRPSRQPNVPVQSTKQATVFANGQEPAFKMVLTSFSPSGNAPSGQSHFSISTEAREFKPPKLSVSSSAEAFRQAYQLGGVSGMRTPESVFKPKALTASEFESISRHHLGQAEEHAKKMQSYNYVQY